MYDSRPPHLNPLHIRTAYSDLLGRLQDLQVSHATATLKSCSLIVKRVGPDQYIYAQGRLTDGTIRQVYIAPADEAGRIGIKTIQVAVILEVVCPQSALDRLEMVFSPENAAAGNYRNKRVNFSHPSSVQYAPPQLIGRSPAVDRLVEAGELGVQTGRGFYDYGSRSLEELARERDRKLLRLVGLLEALGEI